MSFWPALKATRLIAALKRKGWVVVGQEGSHKRFRHPDGRTYIFTFHESVEVGPKMVSVVAKATGLTREDL